ncbi:rod shape-determining protein MreC [Bacteroidetes bacterium endosymbiont of Geopemphigus sp.]|uniref:rod shape-determining protein MreC n=1 Tax=Bacteroidetes bacterium endosymbiont of Geopemphigus sp. TaxID=2047937 RepID=UPI000CD1F9F6|nr:rod shape-determining protein MreC [Bacteroidetes bacterium endosymbiont of Geopemphigus sp.]
MREIFDFFLKRLFFLCFIFLEAFAFFLLFAKNDFHRSIYKGSSLFIVGKIYQIRSEIKDYFSLKQVNEQLAQENASLKNALEISKNPLKTPEQEIEDPVYEQKYTYIPARIIGNSLHEKKNFLTLDKGTLDGIEPDMGVLLPNGIGGVIISVSKHFSTVRSLLNPQTKINARLKRNKYFGTLIWHGQDHRIALLEDIPKYVSILRGDIVETDGKSAIFPQGIYLGKVKDYQLDAENGNYKIRVELATDFAASDRVYVVKNLLKKEREDLKKETLQKESEP